jgi:hypothetical protein
MSDEPHEMPHPRHVGTWRAPDGTPVEAAALPQLTDMHVSINVIMDGRLFDIHEALAFAVAQRDWFRTQLADAMARLQKYEGQP